MSTKKFLGTATLALLLMAGGASAQTSTTSTSTVGTPNTGAGNAAANLVVLGSSAAIALAGLAYLSRRNLPQ
jgi:LPXTG-motif cell wall-anchored protein